MERAIATGQIDAFTVDVEAGQFAQVVVRQSSANLLVTVSDPSGKPLIAAKTPSSNGPEPASWIAEVRGTYTIQVRCQGSAGSVRYQTELTELRAVIPRDQKQIEAEHHLYGAVGREGARDRESRQAALQLYLEAGRLWHDVPDAYMEALSIHRAGALNATLGDNRQASENYNRALEIRRSINDREGQAAVLMEMGNLSFDLGDMAAAGTQFEQALTLADAVGDRRYRAILLNSLGSVQAVLGKRPKALEFFGEALESYRALGDRHGESSALNNVGLVHADLGNTQKAADYYNQSITIDQSLGDQEGEAMSRNNLATVFGHVGDERKALDQMSLALDIYRRSGNRTQEVSTLANMAASHLNLGEKQKALELYQQVLPLTVAAGDRMREGVVLNAMGIVYFDRGEYQKALEYFNPALPLVHDRGNPALEASVLNSIGNVHMELSDSKGARDYLERALPLYRSGEDQHGIAVGLLNTASAYDKMGERQKALDLELEALEIQRKIGDVRGEAISMDLIGVSYHELHDETKSLEYEDRSLELRRKIGDRDGEAHSLYNIAVSYTALGNSSKALQYFLQALPIHRAVGDRSTEAKTLGQIAELVYGQTPDAAIWLRKQSINLFQSIRRDNSGLSDELKTTYRESIASNYRRLAGWLVDRQRFGEAEEVLNLLKDKEASDFIRRDAVADQLKPLTLLDPDKKALDRYSQIVDQIVGLGQEKAGLLAKAAGQPLTPEERAQADQIDRDLSASNNVLALFLRDLEKSVASDSASAKRIEDFRDADSIKGALRKLGSGAVAIYTLVLPDRYVALLVTPGARKAYAYEISETELNQKIFKFRQKVQDPGSDPLPLAQELYRIVFPEGLRRDLESIHANTIMWSVDSTLRYIPLAALHDGKEYLVKRFRNSLITPASLTRLSDLPKPRWQGVGFGVSQAQPGYTALPSVPEELHGIFRDGHSGAAPIPGTVRLDAAFSREAFQNDLRQPNKSVVHIATHFDSRPGTAANSHLLLGDGSQLSMSEIEASEQLFDGVDLLTLSACSTAFTGQAEDGREVDSLGTIAQRLGARAVVASLWNVNDQATARLMETMYRLRERNPRMGKSEALRQAQTQMVSGQTRPGSPTTPGRGVQLIGERTTEKPRARDWSHPFYWAAFILIGNWK